MPNIPVYVIVILLAALAVLGLRLKAANELYDLLQLKHNLFIAQTESKGKESRIKQLELEEAYKTVARKLKENDEKLSNELNSSYAAYDRLRKQNSSSSGVRSLAEGAKTVDCGKAEARLERALERLETGVLERLAKPRDFAVIDANLYHEAVNDLIKASRQ